MYLLFLWRRGILKAIILLDTQLCNYATMQVFYTKAGICSTLLTLMSLLVDCGIGTNVMILKICSHKNLEKVFKEF
jgi:hypothetical protein